ncbi:MAG: glycoside hydrolase family 172 protein [Fimbriimonadales bacterium]
MALPKLSLAFLVALCPAAVLSQGNAPWLIGLPRLHRLDLMPAFRRTVSVGNVSSYDRSGGNDDGFSGRSSFVRKENGNLVLADLKGPGCIYRIHTPTPTDDPLDFYFDGEATPRLSLPCRELFTGKTAPFLRPLVDYAGGGYYCYIPLPYRKSCKIVLRAKSFQFYDLNYATYPEGAPIKTYDPAVSLKDREDIFKAAQVFNGGRSTDLTAFNVPAGTKLTRHPFEAKLVPGKSAILFETKRPGRIASLRIGPAEALAGKDRDILLRITWDNAEKPAVLCPAGDFFGYAWGKPSASSSLIGTFGGQAYCNLPMPFDHAAKVELVLLRTSGPTLAIRGEVVTGDTPRRAYEGKFYAVWHRENPTTEGKPFTFIDAKGRGHIVGLALQAQGHESGSTPFFEGDDMTVIDGQMAIHGTGSEDFFNGGWYDVPDRWDAAFSRGLSGCLAYQKPLGRTGGFRFFLGDAYSYTKSIVQTIEHAPERNEGVADYCSVTYLYSDRPPVDQPIPDLKTRRVVDLARIVFSASWTVPISSFSFADATLSRRSVPAGAGQVRCLSMRAKGGDFFGPPFISLIFDLPGAGKYDVYMDAVTGPEQGVIQLFQDESPTGDAVDLFAVKPAQANGIQLGQITAAEGNNRLMFKIVGKNPAAAGLGFDLVNVIFVRSH